MKVKVCDAIMGSGKTSAAINFMNKKADTKFLFVTPYLKEVERIKAACPGKHFVSPSDNHGSKLDCLHELLAAKRNIVSTHALFSSYTQYTGDLIHSMGYTLIMDEVFGVVEPIKTKKADIKILFESGLATLAEDRLHVEWLDNRYDGTKFNDLMLKAKAKTLLYYKEQLLFWAFPPDIFSAFDDIYLLTYLFDSQMQRYYYDLHGLEYQYIGTTVSNGEFQFSETQMLPPYAKASKRKVHILNDDKLNRIGDSDYALSNSWFQKAAKQRNCPLLEQLRKNTYNVFHNKFKSSSDDNMWTVYKPYKSKAGGGGYKSGFVACNARATNEYANKHYLAYCVNRFFDPLMKQYFSESGVRIDEDGYALSEMIQWIWRSAIRNGEDIWIYIPSNRMRRLLQNWLDELSFTTNT